jgi:hypothetical protein
MDPSRPGPPKARHWILGVIVFVLAFDVVFAWQRLAEAQKSEFGGHPDEAAHYVTGLFIRNSLVEFWRYAAGGFHGSPLRIGREFAESYYTHYPKISLGVWPPFFYLVQSAWTLPFGVSRTSVLLFMCALAGGLGLLMFRTLREEFGSLMAATGAFLLLSLPLVRSYYGMVMAETLSAVLMFGAMLAFGNFLDRERRADALWFGVLAAGAILTKGTGLALVFAVPLAVVASRRFHLLRRPAFWAAVLIIAVVAGPWTWATRNLGKGGWLQPSPSWSFTREAFQYYAVKFGFALGALPLMLFGVGVLSKVRRAGHYPGRWVAAGALILAVMLFQSIAPVGFESRHLIPALPAAVMFVVAGAAWTGRTGIGARVILVAAVAIQIGWITWPPAKKGCAGFAPLAKAMLDDALPTDVTLVSSDAAGEGMFISEVAMHEARPGHVIQRASKSLASSTWSGSGYSPAFASDDDVLGFLSSGQIQYLVIDDALPVDKRREHHEQLKRVIDAHPGKFSLLASSDNIRGGERQLPPIRLYKVPSKK